MDGRSFDEITKAFARRTTSRRTVLKGVGPGLFGALAGAFGAREAEAQTTCANQGQSCNAQKCCADLQCIGQPGSRICCTKEAACGSRCCPVSTDPCKVVVCVGGNCVTQNAKDGTLCSDTNLCTINETCKNGVCQGTPVTCNDNNECTADTCEPVKG